MEAEAIADKRMTTVARFLYSNVLCRHGCPETIITDQGSEFCNSLNEELIRLSGGKHGVTSAYHPQANGLVERANRSIKNAMLKVLKEREEWWLDILPGVSFAQRSPVHASTKFSPFFILYGRRPRLPGELPIIEDGEDSSVDGSENVDGDLENEWKLDRSNKLRLESDEDEPFDMEKFKEIFRHMDKFRHEIDKAVEKNI